MYSTDYRSADEFAGKKVVIIGACTSGMPSPGLFRQFVQLTMTPKRTTSHRIWPT